MTPSTRGRIGAKSFMEQLQEAEEAEVGGERVLELIT